MVLLLRSQSVPWKVTVIWRFQMMTARFRPVLAQLAFRHSLRHIRRRTISCLVSYWRLMGRACGPRGWGPFCLVRACDRPRDHRARQRPVVPRVRRAPLGGPGDSAGPSGACCRLATSLSSRRRRKTTCSTTSSSGTIFGLKNTTQKAVKLCKKQERDSKQITGRNIKFLISGKISRGS